jgi:hypothetical protein
MRKRRRGWRVGKRFRSSSSERQNPHRFASRLPRCLGLNAEPERRAGVGGETLHGFVQFVSGEAFLDRGLQRTSTLGRELRLPTTPQDLANRSCALSGHRPSLRMYTVTRVMLSTRQKEVLRGFAMRGHRWSRRAGYEAVGELDLQLTKMFGVSIGATVLRQQALPCSMNLFDDWIFKLLRHRSLPEVHAVCRPAEVHSPLPDKHRKPMAASRHSRCACSSMWQETRCHGQPRWQYAEHRSRLSVESAFAGATRSSIDVHRRALVAV